MRKFSLIIGALTYMNTFARRQRRVGTKSEHRICNNNNDSEDDWSMMTINVD